MANKLVSYYRSKSSAKRSAHDPESALFVRARGLKYEDFFRHIHATYLLDWYMEVGCRTGTIFSGARGKTIAVDPYFQVTSNVMVGKPALHMFQLKSDDFFASKFLEKNEIKLSLSFLDGMHLFEYLLRDFINTERNSHANGVITMHDCCPMDFAMTTRDLQNITPFCWTGDVWKLIPILHKYRPDLKVTVLNCAGTGLVLVSNLDPGNDVLSKNYDEIVKTFVDTDLRDFGIETFFNSFTFTDAQTFLNEGAPLFARIALDPGQALTLVQITP